MNLQGILQNLYTTRGSIDLNTGLLPTLDNDATVRPTDALVKCDAFVVASGGNVPASVGGQSPLKTGDYLVFMGGDATLATNWYGVSNLLPYVIGQATNSSGVFSSSPQYW